MLHSEVEYDILKISILQALNLHRAYHYRIFPFKPFLLIATTSVSVYLYPTLPSYISITRIHYIQST